MQTNLGELNHKWHHLDPFIAPGWYHVISLGLLSTGLQVCDHASQDKDRTLPFNPGPGVARLTMAEASSNASPPRSWTYGGLAMAESREAKRQCAQLTLWGLASPFNHHTVVHWPGSQLRQKRLKINSIRLPANDCHLSVNVLLIHITHLEAEHLLHGSRSFESH